MAPNTSPSTEVLEPIDPGVALGQLDDEQFVAFVVDLWERRGWTISDSDLGPWYVDLLAHIEWPAEDQTLLRVHRPDSDKPLSRTIVRHFIRTVQQTTVDQAQIVTADSVAESVRQQADDFGVEIVDNAALVDLLAQADAYDLLADRVDRPIATPSRVLDRAPDRLVETLDRFDAVERADRLLAWLLPPDPTTADLATLSFTGFRAALVVAVGLFVLLLANANASVLFWLLLGAFLLATYGFLLPTMAADIYLIRRAETVSWTPTWLLLVPFLLIPLMLLAGGIYWGQRRYRTLRGSDEMWRFAGMLR